MELSVINFWIFGWISLLTIGVIVADAPPLLSGPQASSVRSGETGILNCKFQGNAQNCFWTKDGGPITVSDRYVYMSDVSSGDCSISITLSNLQYDDGMWECGIPSTSSGLGVKSDPAKYTVLSAPLSLSILSDGQEIVDGSNLLVPDFRAQPFVSCVSRSGNPAAQLKFQRNNMDVDGSYGIYNETSNSNRTQTAVLNMTAVMDDSWEGAVLSCIATHDALNSSKQVAYAFIHQPAAPTLVEVGTDEISPSSSQLTVYSSTKEQVHLFCLSNGFPPPTESEYRWERRASDTDQWSQFSQNTQNFSFTAQDGQYSCVAHNAIGTGTEKRSATIIIDTSVLSASQSSLSLAEQTARPQDGSSTAQVGTIIAVVVVCVVLLVVTVGAVYMLYRKRKLCFKDNKEVAPPNPEENGDAENGKVGAPPLRMPDDTDDTKPERKGLMQDDLEKKENVTNVRTDASPKETTNGAQDIEYAQLQFANAGQNQQPTASPKTEYAAIANQQRPYGIQ